MTHQQIESARVAHELAAEIIAFGGYSAKCVKNELCEQPHQVNVKCDSDKAKELQILVCKLLKDDTLNVVEV